MQDRPSAEEHLRVIRSLMERATIYRAISAQAALAGGLLACIAAAIRIGLRHAEGDDLDSYEQAFLWKWGLVLVLSTGLNFFFLWRDARRRGAPFLSAGMRMAVFAMLPPLAVGLVLTPILRATESVSEASTVILWLLVYGLALLSTAHFAPRSLVWLGVLFLVTGLVAAVAVRRDFMLLRVGLANVVMAATFGGYHLAYAACTWPRKAPVADLAASA